MGWFLRIGSDGFFRTLGFSGQARVFRLSSADRNWAVYSKDRIKWFLRIGSEGFSERIGLGIQRIRKKEVD